MADLGQMYNHGMNGLASLYGGQMMAQEQASNEEKLKAMQMENQQAAVMNPLNAQFRQGQINEQQAQLPGLQGVSQSHAAQGQYDSATIAAKIADGISKHAANMGANGLEQLKSDAEKLNYAVEAVKNVPVPQQKQALAKAISAYGGDPNSPMLSGLFQAPDDQFVTVAKGLSDGMAMASSGSKQNMASAAASQKAAMERERYHRDTEERINKDRNDTAMDKARLEAQTKLDVADRKAKAAAAHANLESKVAAILSDPNWKDDPNKVSQYNDLMQSVQPFRNAAANGYVQADLLGGDTPAARFDPTKVSGGGSTAKPTEDAKTKSAVERSGIKYEPDKYMYRVLPSGEVQRAPKK
jgi:hypothetical protein